MNMIPFNYMLGLYMRQMHVASIDKLVSFSSIFHFFMIHCVILIVLELTASHTHTHMHEQSEQSEHNPLQLVMLHGGNDYLHALALLCLLSLLILFWQVSFLFNH